MATSKYGDVPRDYTQDALVKELGPKPGVSNTMPIAAQSGAVKQPDSAAGAPKGDPYTGFSPKYAMEGFDFQREQNPGKSAKDAFAMLSNQAPPPPINDKAALGQWFEQYIRPGMDALGHQVSSVNGDNFRFKNWQGDFNVDYGRGAGADGGALAWQATDALGGAPSVGGGTPATGQAPAMPGQSDLMTQILAALQDQQVDPQALLLQQLR